MEPFSQKFKVAVVQTSPVFLDKVRGVEKVCRLIGEVGRKGAKLILFPESLIPAYPYWGRDFSEDFSIWKRVWAEFHRHSVEIPGEEVEAIGEAAAKVGAYVVVGLSERDLQFRGTLYNTLLFLSPEGKVLGRHRKLVVTHHERLYWGQGDGRDIVVFDTELGKLGGLICYEHHMCLLKYALFLKREQVHCAVWPGWPHTPEADIGPVIDAACRQYAFEGQTFVLAACGYITREQVPDDFVYKDKTVWASCGGSGVISPVGQYLAGPLYGQEGVLYAEVDLRLIPLAKCMVDGVGHYARPDLLSLCLHDQPYELYRPFRREPQPQPELLAELRQALEELLSQACTCSPSELAKLRTVIKGLKDKIAGQGGSSHQVS